MSVIWVGPSQEIEALPVLPELPPQVAYVADSLPELLADPHTILAVEEIAGRRFVRCSCGDLMEIHTPESEWACRMQMAAELYVAECRAAFAEHVDSALEATCRDEAQLQGLLEGCR